MALKWRPESWRLPPDWPWLAASVVLHLVFFGVLAVNIDRPLNQPAGERAPVIEARVIDADRLQQQREQTRAEQRAREQAEQQRRAEQQARQEAEEQARREAQQQARREAEEEARRQAEEEARRQAEQERQQEVEAQAQRRAEEQARQREAEERRERELAEALEREASAREGTRRNAEQQRARDLYISAIAGRVSRNWRRPPAAEEDFQCLVRVRQAPGGEVLEVRMVQSCGDAALDRSVESAVLRSSPLPAPPDPEVFSRELEFVFRPE